jgi:phosphoesterase RecJ-like protein
MITDLDQSIKARLESSQNVLIVSHVRPDGDAIGSLPNSFNHLPGSELIMRAHKTIPDTRIVVDCSDLKRVGKALDGVGGPDIVIDHHFTNGAFGVLNLIEPKAPATCSVLVEHLSAWGLSITPKMAANLLSGIVTDTLGFRTINTTPKCLRQAADMMEIGADLSNLYYQGLVRRTLAAARYWGAGLGNLQYQDGIVWTALSLADRAKCGYTGNDDADLINMVSVIDEGMVSIIFVEQSNGTVKISWRTQDPNLDVSQVALMFNGGGHKAAAGADIPGNLVEIQKNVLTETAKILK